MSDDLQTNFEAYKIQLQQVEAALLAEPSNESLLKLKEDLVEIINITRELLFPDSDDFSNLLEENDEKQEYSDKINNNTSIISSSSSQPPQDSGQATPEIRKWKVGDKCMAVWSKNGQYFEAVIEGITDGKAVITFTGYNVTEINKLAQLKTKEELPASKKYVFSSSSKEGGANSKLAGGDAAAAAAASFLKNKSQWQLEKERRKLKALKKIQRLKQIEEDKEKEKQKWKDFNRKALAKSFKGVKKESIFATSETNCSKVGVGGSGKPMTKFQRQDRHSTLGASKMNYSTF